MLKREALGGRSFISSSLAFFMHLVSHMAEVNIHGLASILFACARYCFLIGSFYAFLESFYRAAQIAAQIPKLLCSKNQDNNDQNDQPMPDAE